jgi:hypothetical protein
MLQLAPDGANTPFNKFVSRKHERKCMDVSIRRQRRLRCIEARVLSHMFPKPVHRKSKSKCEEVLTKQENVWYKCGIYVCSRSIGVTDGGPRCLWARQVRETWSIIWFIDAELR